MLTVVRALVASVLAATVLAAPPAHAGSGGVAPPVVVTGRVVDASGAPVPGVAILVEVAAGQWVEAARADDHGGYRLELDLRGHDGPVYLGVGLLGDLHHYGANLLGDGQGPYPPGTRYEMDLEVPVLAEVSGTVRDAAGRPVPGAAVHFADLEVREEGRVDTDETGQYRALLLPGLRFHVQVVADGFRALDQDLELSEGRQTLDWRLTATGQPPGPRTRRPAQPRVKAARAVAPRRAAVRFRKPTAGGAATAFQAQCRHRGVALRVARDRSSPVVVTRLKPARTYRCRVRARNEAGWSPFSRWSPRFRTPARRH